MSRLRHHDAAAIERWRATFYVPSVQTDPESSTVVTMPHPLADLPDGDERTVMVGSQVGRLALDQYQTGAHDPADRLNACPVADSDYESD